MTRLCLSCRVEKPLEKFGRHPHGLMGRQPRCYVCRRVEDRERTKQLRMDMLRHYSNGSMVCACCGEGRYEFLSLDHINGGGTAERRALGNDGIGNRWYKRLKAQGYPSGLQVLCFNCNFAKGRNGSCPHES